MHKGGTLASIALQTGSFLNVLAVAIQGYS